MAGALHALTVVKCSSVADECSSVQYSLCCRFNVADFSSGHFAVFVQ